MLEPSGISRRFVYRTINRITETGSVKDRKRTGRPRTVRTNRLKRVVSDQISRNPRRSMRKMAAELNVKRESLRRLVVKDLKMHSFKRRTVHHLNPKLRQVRLARCKALKRRLAKLNRCNVLYSDEKVFTIEQSSNSQNGRILSTSSSDIPEHLRLIDRNHHPASVMI